MEKTHEFHTPLNYFEWKAHMDIFMRIKGFYRLTMEIEAEPNVAIDNMKWNNMGDEVYGILCLNLETLFSILMDWHHQIKYGRIFKLYLRR